MINLFKVFGLTTTGVLAYVGIRIMGEGYDLILKDKVKKFINLHYKIGNKIKRGIKNATRR